MVKRRDEARLELRMLGRMEVLRGGAAVELPKSKKTLALLAYLALTRREHRRTRLCELFWSDTSDPKGQLRWSLSKVRKMLEGGEASLSAEGDVVSLDLGAARVDAIAARAVASSLGGATTESLVEAAESFRGALLEGIDLPDCPDFHAWHVAEREEMAAIHARVLDELVTRLGNDPERALPFARRRVELARHDDRVHRTLLDLLRLAGRVREAEEHWRAHKRWLEGQGRAPSPALVQAWHSAVASKRAAPAETAGDAAPPPDERAREPERPLEQQIRFCVANDGVKIAYATVGSGPPLVKTANWLNHLEHDWNSLVWRHWLRELPRGHTLIRYDERGNGLSDWNADDISLDAFVADLEHVVDAAGVDRHALLAISQGCAVAVAYAVRHPERVTRLVLYAGYAQGWRKRGTPIEIETGEALQTLAQGGWGRSHPAFRQVFTSLFFPDATQEQMHDFNELQRRSTSGENARRFISAFGDIDVMDLLPRVRVPTLVLHARHDGLIPFDEGRKLASGIPGARFVPLESRNHLLLEGEPAWERFLDEVRRFLGSES